MTETLTGKKCLASIALFGELAKKKMDVYSTLAEFVKYCIFDKKLYEFSVFEIKQLLFSEFGFSVPEIVINNSIKRIEGIEQENKSFKVKTQITMGNNFDNRKNELEKNQEFIINTIIEYIERKIKRVLMPKEKETIFNIIFEYLIQNSMKQDMFGKYISSFIIENKKNQDIVSSFNIVKEGVLLYSAFQYTPDEYSKETWTTELILYFDTELLFSLYGFNGDLYQRIVNELIELIEKINKNSIKNEGQKIIQLKYFKEIEQEMNYYFNSAKSIIGNNRDAYQTKPAMIAILNGCSDVTGVFEKRGLFY